MIYVGIDVAKDKHDCLITNSDGEVLANSFTISNNSTGFEILFTQLSILTSDFSKIKAGLEATGHYSDNLISFLVSKNIPTFVINPLHTNLFRKSLSLRKTKTDTIDAHSIVSLLRTEPLKQYSPTSQTITNLKSLSRYRFAMVQDCARMKNSFARLMVIIFPELEKMVSKLCSPSIHALMLQLPNTPAIANCHLTKLTNILSNASFGRYARDKAIEIREAAKVSIGSNDESKALELQQTIRLINLLDAQIKQIESQIKPLVEELHSPIMTIPGISFKMAAMILSEISDFENFSSAEKILAFAGMEPSVYQSGQSNSTNARMVKRGSKYLRYSLYLATKYVCIWDRTFSDYLRKKRNEGKHYNVALSHATRKLVRVIYHLEKTGQTYKTAS